MVYNQHRVKSLENIDDGRTMTDERQLTLPILEVPPESFGSVEPKKSKVINQKHSLHYQYNTSLQWAFQ